MKKFESISGFANIFVKVKINTKTKFNVKLSDFRSIFIFAKNLKNIFLILESHILRRHFVMYPFCNNTYSVMYIS